MHRDTAVRRRGRADGPPQPRARSSYQRRSVRNACRRSRRRPEAPRPREITRTSLTVRMALMTARPVPVLVRVAGPGAAAKPIPNQTSAVIRSPACPESWRRSMRCSKRRGVPWRTTGSRSAALMSGEAARTVPTAHVDAAAGAGVGWARSERCHRRVSARLPASRCAPRPDRRRRRRLSVALGNPRRGQHLRPSGWRCWRPAREPR